VFTIDKHGPSGASGVLSVLQTMFPQVTFSVGSEPDQLVAWIQPAQEKEIRQALKTLAAPETADKARKMVVYTLESAGPSGVTSAMSVLSTMFPEVKFSAGTEPHKLVAWARPAEHEKVKAAIAELGKKEPAKNAPRMVVYTLESTAPGAVTSAISVLTLLYPEAKFNAGTDAHKLVAWARPAEHKKIEATIAELTKKEPPDKARKVIVYKIKAANASASYYTLSLLKTMFPDAQFTLGTENDQLVVWARPAEHIDIKSTIDQISSEESPEKAHQMVVYTIETTGPYGATGAMTILTTMFPEAKFAAGTEPSKIVAWARPDDQKKIAAAVAELAKKEPPEKARKIVVYKLRSANASAPYYTMILLRSMFPDAQFTAGRENDRLVVWARPDEHANIKSTIEQISADEAPDKAPQMVVYTLEITGPYGAAGAMTILTTMFPEAKFAAGTEPNKIVAWARPDDQKKIAAAVIELSKKESPETARKVVVYPFKSADANSSYYSLAALRTMFPDAQFSTGADPQKLAVWARPKEHESIKGAIEELTREDPPEKAHKLVIYTLETTGAAGMSGAISILTTMFPDAKFTPGSEPDKVAVWARSPDHKRIEAAVKELSNKEPPDKAHQMVVYALEATGPYGATGAMTILTTMFPEAKFAAGTEPNKVVAWARPGDQKKIAAAVAELSKKEPPETARKMVV